MVQNVVLSRRVMVSILATMLLTFGVPIINHCQFEIEEGSVTRTTTVPELSVDQIYAKAINSVIWIRTPSGGQASGVLISRDFRLAVTNAHVTDKSKRVDVYFPVHNREGMLISDRNFYLNVDNQGVLKELGYYISGRVIAENFKTDLAIVSLNWLPATARQIDFESNHYANLGMDRNDPVEVLGNPGALALWRWTAGRFQTVFQQNEVDILHVKADIFGGNSGGPVLNNKGKLIGIIKSSDKLMNAYTIPMKYIVELLNKLELRQIFSVRNNTLFTVAYQVKWTQDGIWKQQKPLEPGNGLIHWYTGSARQLSTGYPRVRFDSIAGDREVTFKSYSVGTYSRFFGPDIADRIGRDMDARAYHIGYNSQTKKLTLYDSEK